MKISTLLVSLALGGSAVQSSAEDLSSNATSESIEDRATRLVQNARSLPDVATSDAEAAARAALLVETDDISAELLVSVAWGESRFQSGTVTGRACGLVQTIGRDARSCRLMQIPIVGMLAGVVELRLWLHAAHGDVRLALAGYACGWSAFDGSCTKQAWPGWVLRRARALRRPSKVFLKSARVSGRTST